LRICSFCHVTFVGMPFCFLVQNFADIWQSVNELWPKKRFSRWPPSPSRILKISIFCHVTVIGFNIWCSVPNFIKIGRFFTIWRYNDFQNGGCPPSWILKICSFSHVAFVRMPFCFLTQNFAQNWTIGRWVMAKKAIFKMVVAAVLNFKTWSRDCIIGFNICCSVPNFIEIGQCFTEIRQFNDFQNGGRPPSWILKICFFCPVALVNMPFCFLIQNFAEIWQSVYELWPEKRF